MLALRAVRSSAGSVQGWATQAGEPSVSDEDSRPRERGHCPNCGSVRNAAILAEDMVQAEEDGGVWWKSTYSILRCLGCDCRYIRHVEECSEDAEPETGEINERVSYWPNNHTRRRRPDWLWITFEFSYPALSALLKELYAALDHDLCVLASIGMRTVFDCASGLLGANSNQSFGEKLKELVAGNKIGGEEKEILSVLADAGGAAAHRGWKPTASEIDTLMNALENFLERAFVLKHDLRRMTKNIPPRTS